MAATLQINDGDCIVMCTQLPDKKEPKYSPVFSLMGNEWKIEFFYANCGHWIYVASMSAQRIHTEFKSFHLDFSIGFKNEENLSLDKGNMKIDRYQCSFWRINASDMLSQLPPDHLSGNFVKFELRFYFPKEPTLEIHAMLNDKAVQTPPYIDGNFSLEGISKNFSTLLDEDKEHDIEFKCGGETIRAHKNILCSRSAVFASMLRTDMVEGKTRRVKIEDMDGAFFKQFLKYLYTGVLPELTLDTALQLYKTSDKYAVDVLKEQCASFLLDNLTPQNACEVLIVADQHNDADFKKDVMKYMIKEKVPRIVEGWTLFCKDNPLLANEVLNLAFQHMF